MTSAPPADRGEESAGPGARLPCPWDAWLSSRFWWWAAATLLLAAAIRAPRFEFARANTGDQGRYLALAENIRRGQWNWSNAYDIVGSNTAGFTQYQPLLYPLLTGLVGMAATGEVEIAGTIVSFAAGVAAILLAMRLALRLGGPTAALLTGLVMALHPLFINFSTSRYLEMSFTATLLSGVVSSLWAADRRGWLPLTLSGVAWGLCTLTRFEGQNFFALALAYLLLRAGPPRAGAVLAGFLAVTLPFKVWGALATPGDPPQISQVTHTIATLSMGGALDTTPYSVDSRGVIVTQELARQSGALELLWGHRGVFVDRMRENAALIPRMLAEDVLWGGLWILAVAGILWVLITDGRRSGGRFAVAVACLPLLVYSISHPIPRYFLSVLPIAIALAAAAAAVGAGALTRWMSRGGQCGVAGALLLAVTLWGWVNLQPRSYVDVAGTWYAAARTRVLASLLRALPAPPRTVAARDSGFGWMSGARQEIFPLAFYQETLRFLRERGVEYVLIDRPHTLRHRNVQAAFTSPEQVRQDLELIAHDPGWWYLLYRVRARQVPGATVRPDAIVPYFETLEAMNSPDFLRLETEALTSSDRRILLHHTLQQALALRERRDFTTALARADRAAAIAPRAWTAHSVRAVILDQTGATQDALRAWAETVRLAQLPQAGDAVRSARERLGRAGQTLAGALASTEASAWQCHLVAQWLAGEGLLDDALACWDQALAAGPSHPEYHLGRARLFARRGDDAAALAAAREASALQESHPFAHLYAAEALTALGRREEAEAAYQRLAEVASDPALRALARERIEALGPR